VTGGARASNKQRGGQPTATYLPPVERPRGLITDAERAALDYATELTKTKKLGPDTFARLQRYYSEREIRDVCSRGDAQLSGPACRPPHVQRGTGRPAGTMASAGA
jgi:hypothetical protein